MRTATAKKLMHEFAVYDAQRDKQMRKLERVLEKTLTDLRSISSSATPRRRRRRSNT